MGGCLAVSFNFEFRQFEKLFTNSEFRLFHALLLRCKEDPNNPEQAITWPSYETIGSELGISDESVRLATNSLAKKGFLTKQTRLKPDGSRTSCLYVFNVAHLRSFGIWFTKLQEELEEGGGIPRILGTPTKNLGGGSPRNLAISRLHSEADSKEAYLSVGDNAALSTQVKNEERHTGPRLEPLGSPHRDAFDKFIKLYPKDIGEEEIRQTFRHFKRIPTHSLADLLKATEIYANKMARRETEFIKTPINFLGPGKAVLWQDQLQELDPLRRSNEEMKAFFRAQGIDVE